jgi:hypothetical protein
MSLSHTPCWSLPSCLIFVGCSAPPHRLGPMHSSKLGHHVGFTMSFCAPEGGTGYVNLRCPWTRNGHVAATDCGQAPLGSTTCCTSSLWSLLVKKAVPTEIWMEYRYSKSLNKFHFSEFEELLFSKIHKALNLVLAEKPMPKPEMPPEKKEKPDAAFKRRRLFRRSIGLLP